ncbi:MAG: polynucleotide kinase-phosphatase [Acidobacteria bacterium]|nr:polynucleotide kinase-phosphatase [Acidobacteriota bacterium]MBV9474646.1 polynucleotide kinase-phosphatase [Acidobacteriota bacterium]
MKIPELSLVTLIGASGSGKSSFARRHFKPTEVVSSDFCRGLVSDDENDQAASQDAFDLLYTIVRKRLARGHLTVVDATNVEESARRQLVAIAREYHVLPVAIVLDVPERICHDRNASRADRQFGPHVIRRQTGALRRSLRNLGREGFRYAYVLRSVEEIDAAQFVREPLYNNRKHEHGPFDLIGDVHGCYDELVALLDRLGYERTESGLRHPAGRKAVLLGDLVDRGPKTPEVLELVMQMVQDEAALAVPGNHDIKLMRALQGKKVKVTHGLAESLEQLAQRPPEFRERVVSFIDSLVSHFVLDDGRLVVAHAGMKQEMQGRGSGRVREFALFGETTGETDEFGLPVRYNWAADYRGRALVVYGHTPVGEPEWLNSTICIDTGCVFGGRLTALRYPERELLSVEAARMYYEPAKPLAATIEDAHASGAAPRRRSAQQELDDVLDLEDVSGKHIIATSLKQNVVIREENAMAALEVMSRFAANPKWLVYLPPTMSPSDTSKREGLLEHPEDAFAYFRASGVAKVVCEEKHMGSRAVVVVCRDEDVARRRFGVDGEGIGIVYTRTGRRFFSDSMLPLEAELLAHLRDALTRNDAWSGFSTDWFVLDCELMPWSVKAEDLVRGQYASVGAVAGAAMHAAREVFRASATRVGEAAAVAEAFDARAAMVSQYVDAYRRYCWPVSSLLDVRLAPFHVLATEGAAHAGRDHVWHMESIGAMIAGDETGILMATPYRVVDLADDASVAAATEWWESMTARGGEGMVVKPLDFIARNARGLVQPAVKCRGPEYLRIIYGPEYSAPHNLPRLRARRLGGKRSLALREFALGVEALQRFVAREPLRRVHECVFGVLALESEPVDPRL